MQKQLLCCPAQELHHSPDENAAELILLASKTDEAPRGVLLLQLLKLVSKQE